jgi:DNA-binding response OmpR family regulator
MVGSMRSERSRARPSPPSVLIVEDDAIVADSIADAIRSFGYRAIQARDGWSALEALKLEQPAVMLIDLTLPGMSGSEFLRVVRNSSAWSRIPYVIVTATNDPMIRVREDAPVLYKPVDMESLVEVIERHCGKTRPQVAASSVRQG